MGRGSLRAADAREGAHAERMGWSFNWASSYESDFNFDLGVSAGHGMTPDPAYRSRPRRWPWRCHRLPAALGAGMADDRNPRM